MPLEGRKNFTAACAAWKSALRLEVEGKLVSIPLASIDKARLDPSSKPG